MAKNKQKQKFKLTHARHAPEICLAPGLFRSLKRGDKKRHELDVIYVYKSGLLRFVGPGLLGADDLRVLQGLVAMASVSGGRLGPEPRTEIGRQLRLALELRLEAVHECAFVVVGSYRWLAREIGYAEIDGKAIRLIKESIERMGNVSVVFREADKCWGFRLLAIGPGDSKSKKLYVALNPLIARVLLISGARHTRIELSETRALKTDAALITHQHLCARIAPGKTKRVSIDKLCGYPWPDAVNGATMRQRRARMRKALAELEGIGWTVTEYAMDKFEIARPAKPVV